MNLISFIKRLLGLEKRPIRKIKYGPLKFIFKKGYGLSYRTEKKAVKEHNNLIYHFIKKNKRLPTRSELWRRKGRERV